MADTVNPKRPHWQNPAHLLAFWFGAGASPWAPGTVGTLAAIPLYLLVEPLSAGVYLLLVAGLFLAGIWICGAAARDLGVHDHPGIVFDEVVGYLVTMIQAPHGWAWVVAGFVLFRLFDILKPWPIGPVDRRVGGGLGIMLDDVLAGGLALVCVQVAGRIVM